MCVCVGGGTPAVGQLDKGGGGGGELTHRSIPQKGSSGINFVPSAWFGRFGGGGFQGPLKTSGVLLTMCLVFREQRDRAVGHRRKGSKAKRLLQVTSIFSTKAHILHNSAFHDLPPSDRFILSLVI